ncbi:MAG TPA: hypothetical protein VFE58_05625 [Tepidisphaeraceae bacterium]|jgi:hypothetical protein|nr:hypothetical protein [Tepidisphaeraceae bacterium]
MLFQSLQITALLLSGLIAQDAPAPPTPTSPPPAQVDTDSKLPQDASVDQILDALDQRGQNLKDFSASLTLKETRMDLGDSTSQKGVIQYQRKPDASARIHVLFNSKRVGKKILDQKKEYLLDDGWVTDRDYDRKTEDRHQVAKPGDKVDLFTLSGPFPLPIGQPRANVLKLFTVTKSPPAPTDPANTVHITLTPRDGTELAKKFKTIDVWVDTKSEMPKRINTTDAAETTQHQTDFDLKSINTGLKDADFTLDPIQGNWDRSTDKYVE